MYRPARPLQKVVEHPLEVRTALAAARSAKWRAENAELARERQREYNRVYRERKKAGLVAEGRPGRKPELTDEDRRAKRRVRYKAWRAANLEKAREIGRESMRRVAAAKAVAEGREPGKHGRPKTLTPEQIRAKRRAKTERWNAAHIEIVREKARIREQQKRDGAFVSRAKRRLTDEERRLVNVAMAANRRARLRSAGGRYTKDDIIRLMGEQGGNCALCGLPFGDDGYHIDHFIPLARGGTNDPSNLKLTHPACNLKKGARLPDEIEWIESDPPLMAKET
jgi:5-methylcytosine-specific restriction endonuclease McrA